MNQLKKHVKRRSNGQFAPGKHRKSALPPTSSNHAQKVAEQTMNKAKVRTPDQLSSDKARAIFRLASDLMEHYGIRESDIDSFEVSGTFPYNASSVIINGKRFRILEKDVPNFVVEENSWQGLIRRKLVLVRPHAPFAKPLTREYIQNIITSAQSKGKLV